MQGIDPTVVMLDQAVRLVLMEVIRATVWCFVAATFYARFKNNSK